MKSSWESETLCSHPSGLIRPTLFVRYSVNHRLPSGPAVIGPSAVPLGIAKSVTTPAVVILPTWSSDTKPFLYHRFPSGPAVIPTGLLAAYGLNIILRVVAKRRMVPTFVIS